MLLEDGKMASCVMQRWNNIIYRGKKCHLWLLRSVGVWKQNTTMVWFFWLHLTRKSFKTNWQVDRQNQKGIYKLPNGKAYGNGSICHVKHKTEKAFEWQSQVRTCSLIPIQVFTKPVNDYFYSDASWAIAFYFLI